MNQQEFEACIAQIRNGDREGLRRIYECYMSYIYSVIYGVLMNRENAEDVTSDFFIRIWNSAETYRPGNAHKAWLVTIARNMALDFLRKHKKEVLTDDFAEDTANSDDVEGEVLGEVGVMEALNCLTEAERQVVSLKVLGEMTFREIADLKGIPIGTITWRYQNAIKKLKRCGYE